MLENLISKTDLFCGYKNDEIALVKITIGESKKEKTKHESKFH